MSKRKTRVRSLTDAEVGIIRNLLARGSYKNQDILGLLNTVRRLIKCAKDSGHYQYQSAQFAHGQEDRFGGHLLYRPKFSVINHKHLSG